jgi:hypothetical protein
MMNRIAFFLAGGKPVEVNDSVIGLCFVGIIQPDYPRFIIRFQVVSRFMAEHILLKIHRVGWKYRKADIIFRGIGPWTHKINANKDQKDNSCPFEEFHKRILIKLH